MAVRNPTQYGLQVRKSSRGYNLTANDGNGDTYDPFGPTPGEIPLDTQGMFQDKYLEEAFFEIRFFAEECVERGELTYPPSISDTLELANGVYEERYANSGLPRTELIDFLVTALIEALEAHQVQLDDQEVEKYAQSVHALAVEQQQPAMAA